MRRISISNTLVSLEASIVNVFQIPDCRLQILIMSPDGGFSQVMWSWYANCRTDATVDETSIRKWFDSGGHYIDFTTGFGKHNILFSIFFLLTH